MTIITKTIHRVEVLIPDAVWTQFHDTTQYDRMSCEATNGSLEAGSESYADPYEWAEFDTMKKAQEAEKKLLAMVEHFQAKVLTPEERERLTKIIKESAERMKDVTVDRDRDLSTVSISAHGKEDIFMQGEEADNFIKEVEALWEKVGEVTMDECAANVAEPYCENLWN
jgi:hypothetical protein